MKRVAILGAGKGGSALLEMLVAAKRFQVQGIVDVNQKAPGINKALMLGIRTYDDWTKLPFEQIDVIIEATGLPQMAETVRTKAGPRIAVIPSHIAYFMFSLMEEKQLLVEQTRKHASLQETILQSTHDGMIAIDEHGSILLFNHAAERMSEVKAEAAIGRPIREILPSSQLERVVRTKKKEINHRLVLDNGVKIVTTRVPLMDQDRCIGALAVFKDITEVVELAEHVTNLKSVQTMLEAIIKSSEDAISVVDELGKGIMINPAYTRLTGLTPEQIIGQPATTDISEGESMHMQVLRTRRPVRGARMKVGPKKREVVVNVAPVIVDGALKGSVAVIHDMSEIKKLTDELEKAKQLIRNLEAKYTFEDIIGSSAEFQVAVKQAKLAASTPATILLRGESGTGKELFAHAIHNASSRKYNKFIRVNCAALSETLLESELFGYEEGAFSGAKRGGKRGLFEEANHGSIFLDEIGELSSSTQAKLLRVLQEKEIVRVGGTKAIPIDVRVIAATNVNLEKSIQDKTFREDLFYRLNKMPIYIPALKERLDDIPDLVDYLLSKLNADYGRNVEGVTVEALNLLMSYHWPGNVRELENILARAMIYMPYHSLYITAEHLPSLGVREKSMLKTPETKESEGSLQERVNEYEKQVILETLAKTGGNKTLAAKQLDISVRNLYYKLEKHGID
ncbi:sigma 54-interacting transcriptional regulator [Halalkalibacterium halodurans]|uniref:sigma 54-interacting transcriptional regulator n=1 Tax=Halalkalibacterium halodurans TaxID=86665 RepID=UPI002AA97F4C|nr:sigma 54-interacting transcriptional regulator [Halalkalibacterium halodurans]MDY7223317.1 sigma 54-interacting transcriptional regulator [Halalkalibacterium halodurans]MDY7242538.1 sigma 54-interacting transcriptional regulator [Halalkalibacterium halodurans]MED3647946.1 sigma 54-interacting transcriptional regulator [Halalkalibacterium halodurans]MED4122602.1 sigma 54-interacting transcriptional regulator [Halalkalibacterium halodurans]MED4161510.1 sigma 54-interacting transcriptional reg